MRYLIAFLVSALPAASRAQPAADALLGYVVRSDSGTVVLDFNEKSNAAVGQTFLIFQEGEELKHPVTGKVLGKLEVPIAEGSLKEILPLYSLGALSAAPARPIIPGMRARLRYVPAAPLPTPAPQQPAGSLAAARAPLWRGPALDYQATAMAVADCDGDGRLEAALSDGRKVLLYPYPPRDAKPLAQFEHKGNDPRILSLEAADLNGDGRAEIFASLYNGAFSRFETVVLGLDAQGRLAPIAEIPCLVRRYQEPDGKPRLAAQQVAEDRSFPFGAIYPLAYQDGKYGPAKPAVSFVKRRVDWLYDFTFATLDGMPATVSVSNTELVRVQFPNGRSVKTDESYCQTPNRVRWTGERMLHFRPPMAIRYDDRGSSSLYLIKNIAAFGGLASPLGIFSRGELTRMDWNGLSLAPAWVAELGGYSTGLAVVAPPGGAPELAVAVVGTAGKTAIWAFAP